MFTLPKWHLYPLLDAMELPREYKPITDTLQKERTDLIKIQDGEKLKLSNLFLRHSPTKNKPKSTRLFFSFFMGFKI